MKGYFLLAVALSLVFASCDKDSDAGNNGGAPVTFTAGFVPMNASVPNTRLTTNDNWAGLVDRTVAIEIDGAVKSYTIDDLGNLASVDPFYWGNRTELNVNAWYPYNKGTKPVTPIVKADQRGSGYWESDHLEVVTSKTSPEKSCLSFRHRTTQLVCNFAKIVGVGNNGISVRYLNLQGVEEGTTVRATADCKALVVPQTVPVGTEFMEITLKDNRTFTYSLTEELNLQQEHSIGVEVEMSENGIKVTFADSTTWNGSSGNVDGNTSTVAPDAGDADWNGNTDDVTGGISGVTPGNNNTPTWSGNETAVEGEKQTNK